MRALATFALGEAHERLLDVALPSFREYADEHGYELLVEPPRLRSRPASWLKVALLRELLVYYREVLWIDCDVVIVDPSRDLADELSPDDWHALVRHHTPDGEVPNCGVWLVRREMRETLKAIWKLDRYLDHPWWEQAALLDLLGYGGRPVSLVAPTELYARTCWLDLEWNSHEERDRHESPRFAHATCGSIDWRLGVMHRYAKGAVAHG